MDAFDDLLKRRRQERERLLEPSFEPALPDRTRVEAPSQGGNRYGRRERDLFYESLGSGIAMAPIDVPGRRPGALSKLASGFSRVALEPLIPAESVAKASEIIPGATRPSEGLGKLASRLAEPFTREEALRRRFAGTSPSPREILQADIEPLQTGPIAPREAVRVAAEFGPSLADVLSGGTSKALGLGLMAAGALRDAGKGAESAKQIGKIAKELKAAEASPAFRARIPKKVLGESEPFAGVREMLERPKKPAISAELEETIRRERAIVDAMELRRAQELEHLPVRVRGLPTADEALQASGRLVSGEPVFSPTFRPGRSLAQELPRPTLTKPIEEVGPGGLARRAALKRSLEEALSVPLLEYKPLKPPAVMSGSGISRGEVAVAQVFRTPDDFLREIAGKPMVPREAAEGIANAARNLQYDTQVKANEGAAALDGILRGLKRAKGKDRVSIERALAMRLDFGVPTGSETLDNLAKQIDDWQRGRFNELSESLVAAGKEAPKPRQSYLPHHNERLGDAIRKYEANPQGAIDDVEALYRESNVTPPPREQLEQLVNGLYRERTQPAGLSSRRVATKSAHVEEARTLDVPGYLADIRRPDFKAGDLVRALEAYNQETAYRLADIKHFGADGEKFTAWHGAIQNQSVREYASQYRDHLIHALSDDPLQAETSSILSAIRSYQAANKLGRAAIANFFQTAVTTLPKSVNQVGFKGVWNYAKAFFGSMQALVEGGPFDFPGGERLAAARRAGAVYDHSVADLAGISHKGFMGRLADWQLKAFGFVPTERFNNTVSFHAGRFYGEDLADAIKGGNRQAVAEARRLLAATPDVADQYLATAQAGQAIPDEILDRIGFEFARATQFRADPTTLPLKWVTPLGQTVAQFKNFGYQYSRFLQKDVFGPALKGNVAPLATWMAMGGLTGPAITWGRKIAKDPLAAKRAIEGDQKEREKFKTAINADAWLQAFGFWGDVVNATRRTGAEVLKATGTIEGRPSFSRAMGGIPEMAAGPTFGEPIRATRELVEYRESPLEVAAGRLPLGPLVPAAESLARGVEMPATGQQDALEELLRRRRAARGRP